ncbi:MAG: transcriptional repressor [Bdellovibrionales bacterium]|nr:transcriptional repressor [Bdellovibrionales bacterium]
MSDFPKLSPGIANEYKEELVTREPISDSQYKRMIRDMGLKVTHQRLAILRSLSKGRAHVTAQEVFENLHQDHPDMGFATVYRFLRKLTEEGFVTEIRMGGLPARYELKAKTHHDHLTCIDCGKIIEFENQEIESLQEKVAKAHGFQLTDHVLELYGTCHDCPYKRSLAKG